MSQKQKILITGAAGFLGSALTHSLVRKGHQVVAVDNLAHGDLGRLKDLTSQKDLFSFHNVDVRDASALRSLVKGVQQVVHFAELKIPRYGSAMETLEVNFTGTDSVLTAAASVGARFIFGSTDEVYGKSREQPLNEEGTLVMGATDTPRWSYATSKIMGEQLCFGYGEDAKLPFVILRFGSGYGPGQSRDWQGGPISVFIDAALQNKAIPVHGDGRQTRCFTYIDDLIAGTEAALFTPYATGEIINISRSEPVSIINLAYQVWRSAGANSKPTIEFTPYTEFSRNYEDVTDRTPDVAKAKHLLGFVSEISLAQGVEKTIAWQRISTN